MREWVCKTGGGGQFGWGKGNVETKIFLKLLFWGGVRVVGNVECGSGWGRGVGCHHLGVRALKVHERVWGTLQKSLMMNLGCSGPLGLCHLTHRQLPNPMTPSHPTFVQVCTCLGMCSSRTQLCVSLSLLRRLMSNVQEISFGIAIVYWCPD